MTTLIVRVSDLPKLKKGFLQSPLEGGFVVPRIGFSGKIKIEQLIETNGKNTFQGRVSKTNQS